MESNLHTITLAGNKDMRDIQPLTNEEVQVYLVNFEANSTSGNWRALEFPRAIARIRADEERIANLEARIRALEKTIQAYEDQEVDRI